MHYMYGAETLSIGVLESIFYVVEIRCLRSMCGWSNTNELSVE